MTSTHARRSRDVLSSEPCYAVAMSGAAERMIDTPEAAPRWLRAAPFVFLALWCSGFSFIKVGLAHASPMTFLAMRHALALAVLLAIALALRPTPPRNVAQWVHLAAVGVLVQFVYFGLCYVAVDLGVSAGGVALVVSLQPILVGILAPSLVGERVGATRWSGLLLGLAGAVLVILARSSVTAPSYWGLLAAVGALLGMTLGTIYDKRLGVPQHPVTANAVQYAAGLVISAPLALGFETVAVEWTGDFVVALLYLTVASSLISTTLLLLMIRHGELSRVSALLFLVPPGAALAAWLIAGETLPPLAWVGMAVAGAGVALAASADAPRTPG